MKPNFALFLIDIVYDSLRSEVSELKQGRKSLWSHTSTGPPFSESRSAWRLSILSFLVRGDKPMDAGRACWVKSDVDSWLSVSKSQCLMISM